MLLHSSARVQVVGNLAHWHRVLQAGLSHLLYFFQLQLLKCVDASQKNEDYCIKQQHRSLMLTKINVVMRINIQVYLLNSLVNVHTFSALSVEIFLHSIFTLFYHKMYQKHSRVKAEHILCHCCLSLLSTEH